MSQGLDWTGVVDYAKRYPVESPKTQYELPGVTEEMHHNVPVAVVPLWHAVVTACLPEGNVGFTKVLVTTHRQNFLLPPRVHRSMPLAEML